MLRTVALGTLFLIALSQPVVAERGPRMSTATTLMVASVVDDYGFVWSSCAMQRVASW
jgi:hypothetical protein